MLLHLLQLLLLLLLLQLPRRELVKAATTFTGEELIKLPKIGDLLIGRESHLTANSTCGEDGPEKYCQLPGGKEPNCKLCDSTNDWDRDFHSNSMRVKNIVAKIRNPNTTFDTWWQSRSGDEHVTIELNLGKRFTFTHVIMIFRGHRPKAWWLERSSDLGLTYKPYGYFSENCTETFPGVPTRKKQKISDVTCSSAYTEITPRDRGQVVFNTIPQRLSETLLSNFSAEALKMFEEQTTITNLRFHFVNYHKMTIGKNLAKFYSLYEMNVHGMCMCNGHATSCMPQPGFAFNEGAKAVYGYCRCAHNTEGDNCERCEPQYNDQPWRPATSISDNACKRCDCNGHADRCVYSVKRFEETGHSGGVCIGCQHNTTGVNCDRCKSGTYINPDRAMSDPDICLPCQCSPAGSKHSVCESSSDKDGGTIAGQCPCKENVGGQKCDECKPGFWNLQLENPAGCSMCDCVLEGTANNSGCNKYTGNCKCKVNVKGQRCDKCKRGFFNLGISPTGCEPCRCDFGGSVSTSDCHFLTGQCTCKPGFTGRQCNLVEDGKFVPEFNVSITAVQIEDLHKKHSVPKKLYPEVLTGSGGVQMQDKVTVELKLPSDLLSNHSGNCDVALKLVPHNQSDPVRLVLTFKRDKTSSCAEVLNTTNLAVTDGRKALLMAMRQVCIDGKGNEFLRISAKGPGSVVVDALLIGENLTDPMTQLLEGGDSSSVPDPGFSISVSAEIIEPMLNCADYWPLHLQGDTIPRRCQQIIRSFSAKNLTAALSCDCEQLGSEPSANCQKLGGQCKCYPNIVGRRCSKCAEQHYGYGRFGDVGCLACDCSVNGSISQSCDLDRGKCSCRNASITGRRCSKCIEGHFSFPECKQCQCNNKASACEQNTGVCIGCKGNTQGKSCESCKTGFYGNPVENIKCRQCLCPERAMQHADSCQLTSKNPISSKCDCKTGYIGDNCGRCDTNYYGDPSIGPCQPCSCNGNIDVTIQSCDQRTGYCNRCLNNTEGISCEKCKPGFYGDASIGKCNLCKCNLFGTSSATLLPRLDGNDKDVTAFRCDRRSGSCSCKANVEGKSCDRCKKNFFNLTSGSGCSACDCDPVGSQSLQCNLTTGQCSCKPGRSGQKCDRCTMQFYGDPQLPNGCKACDCNLEGSVDNNCNSISGQCTCKLAITGRQCDRCERGSTGKLPNCTTCGSCWYNWDKSILLLQDRVSSLRANASEVAGRGGLTGELAEQVASVNASLAIVSRVLNETQVGGVQVQQVRQQVQQLLQYFNESKPTISDAKFNLSQRLEQIQNSLFKEVNNWMKSLSSKHFQLKRKIEKLTEAATKSESDELAENLKKINETERKFNESREFLNSLKQKLQTVTNIANEVNVTLLLAASAAKDAEPSISAAAANISQRLLAVELQLPQMTQKMCVGRNDSQLYNSSSNFCSAECGGPASACGAGTCAAASTCGDSVLARLRNANDTIARLRERIDSANGEVARRHNQLNSIKGSAAKSENDAKAITNAIDLMKSQHEQIMQNATKLKSRIENFLNSSIVSRGMINDLVNRINSTELPVTLQQLTELATDLERRQSSLNISNADSAEINKMRTAMQRVSDLLQQAQAVREAGAQQLAKVKPLSQKLSSAKEKEKNVKDALAIVRQELSSVKAGQEQLKNIIGKFENLTSTTNERMVNLEAKVQNGSIRKAKIENRIQAIRQEQNETQAQLQLLQANLQRINMNGSRDAVERERYEAERRQGIVRDLERRAAALGDRISGSAGASAAINMKMDQLTRTMKSTLDRLNNLMEKLAQSKSDKGSAAYIQEKIRKQSCNRQ